MNFFWKIANSELRKHPKFNAFAWLNFGAIVEFCHETFLINFVITDMSTLIRSLKKVRINRVDNLSVIGRDTQTTKIKNIVKNPKRVLKILKLTYGLYLQYFENSVKLHNNCIIWSLISFCPFLFAISLQSNLHGFTK